MKTIDFKGMSLRLRNYNIVKTTSKFVDHVYKEDVRENNSSLLHSLWRIGV